MIDAHDLAMLAASFEAALLQSPNVGAADEAMYELGWIDLLDAAPLRGAAAGFNALGATGATASLLDDVVLHTSGVTAALNVCVVHPAPNRADPPGRRLDEVVRIDGLVSARAGRADRAVVSIASNQGATTLVELDADLLVAHDSDDAGGAALDPGRPYRRVRSVEVAIADTTPLALAGSWDTVVADARLALAHQLVAASRVMLEQARLHALDRVQFGRPISSFQAVRHRLAEALVAIEGAAAVAETGVLTGDGCDPLLAAAAKSLAGRAARIAASNAQQVLAGIGFTTEHPFHLSLKCTMVLDTLYGSARTLPAEIGRSLLERRSAPRLVDL